MNSYPELQFGDHLLEPLELNPDKTVIATMEFPWKPAASRLRRSPRHVLQVERMEREHLDKVEKELPPAELIIGIGGGSCMDYAKYLSWKRNLRLVSLGILLMARLQQNRPDWLKKLLEELGMWYHPAKIDLETSELRDILSSLHKYCQDEKLPRTIISEREISSPVIDDLLCGL